MAIFVALYSGASVGEAKLIAVSVDPDLVAEVSARLLKETEPGDADSVVAKLEMGRRKALRCARKEAMER